MKREIGKWNRDPRRKMKDKEYTFCHLWAMAKSQMGVVSLSDCKLFAYALHSKEIPQKSYYFFLPFSPFSIVSIFLWFHVLKENFRVCASKFREMQLNVISQNRYGYASSINESINDPFPATTLQIYKSQADCSSRPSNNRPFTNPEGFVLTVGLHWFTKLMVPRNRIKILHYLIIN